MLLHGLFASYFVNMRSGVNSLFICFIVGWQTPKKRLIKEVRTHHKKDGFFLHNIIIWCLKDRKIDVVLTDYCQIYVQHCFFEPSGTKQKSCEEKIHLFYDVFKTAFLSGLPTDY